VRSRLETSLIVVGYFVVAIGSGMMLWVNRFYIQLVPADAQLYQLAVVIYAALLVSAWRSILGSASNVRAPLGRRSLRVFALAAAILEVGYAGEVRDFSHVSGFGPLIGS
jgi:hypothetical protein